MAPQYLTGDKAAIEAFLDRFDVSPLPAQPINTSSSRQTKRAVLTMTWGNRTDVPF